MRKWMTLKLLYLTLVIAPPRMAKAIAAGIEQHSREQLLIIKNGHKQKCDAAVKKAKQITDEILKR